MAKKELKDDLFDAASISDGEKKNKAAEKKAAKSKKKAEKLVEKRTKIEDEIRELKVQLADETNDARKEELQGKISKAKEKLASVGNGVTVAKNTKRIIQSVVAAVIVVAIVVTYVATGTVRKGPVHSTLQWTAGLTAVTVTSTDGDKINVPVSVYNYYYSTTYNSLKQTQQVYKQYNLNLEDADLDVDFSKPLSSQKTTDSDNNVITWEKKLEDKVVRNIEDVYTYYNEAIKANDGKEPEITDEQQSELNKTLDSYKETANKYGFTLSAYLVKAMGKGVTESVFRQESKRAYIADNYKADLEANKKGVEYSAEDLAKYQSEHLDELVSVDIRIFEAETADDAAAFKKALKADGSNFTELCVKYSKKGFEKDYFAQAGASTQLNITKEALKRLGYAIATADDVNASDADKKYSGLDWLFSADRKAGDVNQYSTSVVYVIKAANVSNVENVNVRHILITPFGDEKTDKKATEATDKQWKEAYKKAESILKEYNKGKKTAESFGELAKKNSADGSSTKGGLYEDVYPNQMVDAFNEWCFNTSRKAGDVGIVKTEFGYHVMYFEGKTGTKVWEKTAKDALVSENSETEAQKLDDKYSAKLTWFGSRYIEKDVDIDR